MSQRRVETGKPVGDGVHRLHQVAGEAEAVEVVAHAAAAQVDEDRPQLGPEVALRGLLERQRLGQPRGRKVGAQHVELGLQRFVGGPVLRRKELVDTAAESASRSAPNSRYRSPVVGKK